MKVGDKVKLTRRPFFSGVIKAVQQEFFSDWGGQYLCQWFFKSGNSAVSRALIKGTDLKRIEE